MKNLKTATVIMALSGGLVTWGFVAVPSEAAVTKKPAVAGAVVSVSPNAEYTEDPLRSTPATWVSNCPQSRFCTTQTGSTGRNIGFQFYRCTEYALTNWGVNGNNYRLVYNNQNVTVKYLNRRHGVLDSTSPWTSDVVNFKPVWYISLCN
ncbi:hypothetical protein E1281_39720 [Actinomadura sp. KC345]|uniref:hypothetical protein n=1 Tax=Actinomadura sp. KC345 TaxID=2530371 RepID=UPI001047AD07|nr:hypothetical protein [Actinomadura sp. KC345]TDC36687.1 hypothetical protein E1281_39720 [Actinomadura sp. KC345]